jgi:MATE family multidrug resistance protein
MQPAVRSPFAKLLALSWPIVLSRGAQSVIGFSDAVMVAPLGEAPLAAATTGALNTMAWVMLPMGTVFIIQSFVAQLRGRGDLAKVSSYARYGLIVAAGAGGLAVAAIPLIPRLVHQLHYAPEVEHDLTVYLSVRMLSVGAVVGTEALGNWYGGLGNTRLSMIAGLVAMVTNVAGNYLLVQPRFGLPGYGVGGSATASVVATWLGFAVVLVAFVRGYGWEKPQGAAPGLHLKELYRVLRFGLPNGVNWFLEFAAFALFIDVVVAHLGTAALAAFNVVMQINMVSFMPAFGVTSAGAILAGEALGRRATAEVWPLVKLTFGVTASWMVFVGLLYLVAPEALMGLFAADAAERVELVRVGATMLTWAAVWQLFDATNLTLSEVLRAAGDTTWCMWVRVGLAWGVFTPLAWAAVLILDGGVHTVMLALIVYLAILSVAFAWRFAQGHWKRIDLIGTEPEFV